MTNHCIFIAIAWLLTCSSALNVSYDGRAVLINNERKLLVAGSMHYPRSTPSMWPRLMSQAKTGGLDVVSTYVFWNLHEVPNASSPHGFSYDFETGRRNLTGFLAEAQKNNLFVFLRIGPFVCSEWNYGKRCACTRFSVAEVLLSILFRQVGFRRACALSTRTIMAAKMGESYSEVWTRSGGTRCSDSCKKWQQ